MDFILGVGGFYYHYRLVVNTLCPHTVDTNLCSNILIKVNRSPLSDKLKFKLN